MFKFSVRSQSGNFEIRSGHWIEILSPESNQTEFELVPIEYRSIDWSELEEGQNPSDLIYRHLGSI